MSDIKVIVRNGFTALDAAALCVFNGVDAAEGLAEGLWDGHPEWFSGGAFVDDVQTRIDKIRSDESYGKIYEQLVENDMELLTQNVEKLADRPVKPSFF
jgi:hypothetical protein